MKPNAQDSDILIKNDLGTDYSTNTMTSTTVSNTLGIVSTGTINLGHTYGQAYGISDKIFITDSTMTPTLSGSHGALLKLQGDNADIDINGVSIKQSLKDIQERLNILTVNPELESEWQELRELGEQYRKLEKQCIEKATVWNNLKKVSNP